MIPIVCWERHTPIKCKYMKMSHSPCMNLTICLWIRFCISTEPNRDLASSGLWHLIEAWVVWAAKAHPSVKPLTGSTKRWQYFTKHAAVTPGWGIIRSHWFTALVYSFSCIEFKKKVLWELVKEYLKSILSCRSVLRLYMSRFNIYNSLLDWIVLLGLNCSVFNR